MTSKELNKSKEEIDVLLENLKQVETILKAYKFDLESSREIIDELDNENKKLKKAIEILYYKAQIQIEKIDDKTYSQTGYVIEVISDYQDLSKEEYELLKEVLYEQRIIRR